MDLEKIGKFLAEVRKEKGLSQGELASKIYVSDRAVSKWERGKGLPSASVMIPLCDALGISVNELLIGERLPESQLQQAMEKNVLAFQREKEESDRKMLLAEGFIGTFFVISVVALMLVAAIMVEDPIWKYSIITFSSVLLLAGVAALLYIEMSVGYFLCPKCGHKHIPSYREMFFAQHMGRTRRLKCPKCGQKGWHKKVTK